MTYGFEFQGDNVLIARVNLLMTFEEYLQARWEREPTEAEWEKLINIIVWNIWQMDGLSGTIPYGTAEEEFQQMDLFGMFAPAPETKEEDRQPNCRIFNWRGDRSMEYLSLKRKGDRAMKFDFIIGNPPYQDEALGENKGYAPPIYHLFLDGAYQVADKVELIHPARFLFNAGSTPKAWNQKMLSDPHLKVLHYEQDAKKIFPNTEIIGGIAITYPDERDRIRHILQEQVFGMAPTRIIYLIATNYILGFDEELKHSTHNFVEADAAEASKLGTLDALVEQHFGQ